MSPLFILFFAAGFVASQRNFYRHDYTYIEEYDAFYKLHYNVNQEIRTSTFSACEDEGAELFYPNTREEWTVVKKLVQSLPYTPIISLSDIFVGQLEKFDSCEFNVMKVTSTHTPRFSFETFGEGNCVHLDINTGFLFANNECVSDRTFSTFVCKKAGNVATCPSIGYQYSNETNKCYKVNHSYLNWCKAMEACIGQGGVLLTVESKAETTVIRDKILRLQDKSSHYYEGAKKLSPDQDYYTNVVTGIKLSDSGFERFPDYGKHDCVVLWWTKEDEIYLTSNECDSTFRSICEMKVSV
ncbi:hypothetical protein ABMA27_003985 [Loxostege sticticalis]|uniref:C-type lectin domain-containing protein n=1 Tax=Loxostege sticticalis TaxID=481309 RepID=A0ABR3HR32_LOXSC